MLEEGFNPSQDGQTPITEEDRQGLLLPLTTLQELNDAEAENILTCQTWVFVRRRRLSPIAILTTSWVKSLHQRMFNEVWQWAGEFRDVDTNLGVAKGKISYELSALIADIKVKVEFRDSWGLSEEKIAIELAHKAVLIHPFPNGNGRWARDLGDALIVALGKERFTWGAKLKPDQRRAAMLTSIRKADNGDLESYLEFAKS